VKTLLFAMLCLVGCTSKSPLVEPVDNKHISFIRDLDAKCRKAASRSLTSENDKVVYLMSKPLGRLYETYILVVNGDSKPGKKIVCQNELPGSPVSDAIDRMQSKIFMANLEKFKSEIRDIDTSPGSFAKGLLVILERKGTRISAKEYWLAENLVADIGDDFLHVWQQ
jgi:hypothetical protein